MLEAMHCEVCGEPLPEGARFCPNCGTAVGPLLGTEERKMVTVLFADLVDSTGLARRLDPERAREILGRFFDAASEELQAFRGRPEKFIGDAVMAVFGLPTVHEDDALRAIRAGLAIRSRVHRMSESLALGEPLQIRIGIESGEAATGLGPAGQLLVTGPVVNAAARLQAAAEPSEVLAGETTVALTTNAVSYAGRRVLVTVLGEPGIGKTRLGDELTAGLGDDVPVLAGHARTFTDTATFAPAATILAELADLDEADPPEKARRR